MTFLNRKKTYLAKMDKSKKGEIDERIIPLIALINQKPDYFTTSSCSGRILLWQCRRCEASPSMLKDSSNELSLTGSGKKNEIKWLKVSHNLICRSFFKNLKKEKFLTWLRLEPLILHVCCKDLASAVKLLNQAKTVFKKSSILTISNKIIVEIRGSEFLEIPLVKDREFLIKEEKLDFLVELVNQKLKQVWQKTKKIKEKINGLS